MARHFANWLSAYTELTLHSEAPLNIHFFSAVSAIAGALGRKVWFDQGYFKWYPNFYTIIVARPGIATKSTSIGLAADILREIPGVHLGPSSITWQALVQHMGGVAEQVEINGELHTMSASTFVASELGTLIDFTNREMIDVLVDLWDGKSGAWEKMTKMKGIEQIVNPWISLIAGTTPAWLASNVPEHAVGGGFTSRCVFVYGAEKRHLVAYPRYFLPKDFEEHRQKLIADLEQISMIKGEYILTDEALEYGDKWYRDLWTNTPEHLLGSRYEGYLSRKQTHMHKLMMVLSAAERDDRIITLKHFQHAENLFRSIEDDMILALNSVGRISSSVSCENLVEFVKRRGKVPYDEAIRYLSRSHDITTVEEILRLALVYGVNLVQGSTGSELVWNGRSP